MSLRIKEASKPELTENDEPQHYQVLINYLICIGKLTEEDVKDLSADRLTQLVDIAMDIVPATQQQIIGTLLFLITIENKKLNKQIKSRRDRT